jgi:hypothetical protein
VNPDLEQRVDVGRHRAGKAPDLGVETRGGDRAERLGVVLGHAREARLDPLDAQGVDRPRDRELLLGVERHAHGLLAVAQRGVV